MCFYRASNFKYLYILTEINTLATRIMKNVMVWGLINLIMEISMKESGVIIYLEVKEFTGFMKVVYMKVIGCTVFLTAKVLLNPPFPRINSKNSIFRYKTPS